jgi:putative DNA methylase
MYRKKLIEVALPLEAINKASANEKSIRHGHPFTLHLWWARRPLSACRAVLFASLVDDPSSRPDEFPSAADQERERQRLFGIIERLVLWENVNNKTVFDEAKAEIAKSTNGHAPTIYDPFCGGGSIVLEAQRLGLVAEGSDLNPVAVLITKALTEIPSKFANRAPVNPEARRNAMKDGAYPGALGLAEDVRYYGAWVRAKALERIGHLYPTIKLSDGANGTVIAWLWARTVKCPNPACGASMPLISSFALSMKVGKQAWIEPEIDHATKTVNFHVRKGAGKIPSPPKTGRGAKFKCLVCDQLAHEGHIKTEAQEGRMGARLLAIVAEGKKSRDYLEATTEHEVAAAQAKPEWGPEQQLAYDPRNLWCTQYGLKRFRDLFTDRQLVALTTLSDLVTEARQCVRKDGGSEDYANAISTYLAFLVDQVANHSAAICGWNSANAQMRSVFARQALPMVWDFAESNPFSDSSGSFNNLFERQIKGFSTLGASPEARIGQLDATRVVAQQVCFSTDPPYYDNISYADLSDFFYVWLRRSLFVAYPELLSTLLVPKGQELIATPYRFDGDTRRAQEFFESGFELAMDRIRAGQEAQYPVSIFYAFKQSESEESLDEDDAPIVASTGWETMLEGLLRADLQVTGTWPMRSEKPGRSTSVGTNALASSIVLVCRPRIEAAPLTTRKDFLAALKRELPPAIRTLQIGNIAPVDLQQAAIGPGMGIFSRYKKVIESDGTTMRVRTALGLINQALDEALSDQESDYDAETRWALTWFEQNQFNEGLFGDANTLANAKALSVEGLQRSGILVARGGRVRLLKREELQEDWDPSTDIRLTVWEVTQQMILRLATRGQGEAAALAAKVGGMAETARELAYRLYLLCERKGWAEEAGFYNALVIAWPAIRSQEFTLTGEQ